MPNIIGTNKVSKCMFCGAGGYGNGCPYSPHKRHVHVDDPKRCIYCGSTSFGNGCPYNPYSKIHVHGVEYNYAIKESILKSFMAGLFVNAINTPIIETQAYKLGIVDSNGCKVRQPVTIEEKNACSPLDMYIFKLKRLVGESKLHLLSSSVLLENKQAVFNEKIYEIEQKSQVHINQVIDALWKVFEESLESGVSKETLQNQIFESLIKRNS